MMPRGGGENSYLLLWKGRTKGASHQLQAPFDDQPWNETNFERLYESIWVRFWRFPKDSLSFQWSSSEDDFIHMETSIVALWMNGLNVVCLQPRNLNSQSLSDMGNGSTTLVLRGWRYSVDEG